MLKGMDNCCDDCEPYFFITYKYIRKVDFEIDENMYVVPLDTLKKCCIDIARVTWEHDSKNKLHLHVICRMKKRPSLRELALKGFSVNIRYVYNRELLNQYLNKEQDGVILPLNNLNEYMF